MITQLSIMSALFEHFNPQFDPRNPSMMPEPREHRCTCCDNGKVYLKWDAQKNDFVEVNKMVYDQTPEDDRLYEDCEHCGGSGWIEEDADDYYLRTHKIYN